MVSAVASTHFDAELERVGKTSAEEAKRPETRARRVTGTVDAVRQGKRG